MSTKGHNYITGEHEGTEFVAHQGVHITVIKAQLQTFAGKAVYNGKQTQLGKEWSLIIESHTDTTD